MHLITDKRVWAYAVFFAGFYAVMKFVVPWHLIVS